MGVEGMELRSPTGGNGVKEVDFYGLPRPVQDALLDAFVGKFSPVPLLWRPALRPTALLWVGASVASALLLLLLSLLGFGDAESALALHPTAVVAVYALLVGATAFGVLRALALRAARRALPFAPGLYLFPANLIDAREHTLRVHPLATLTGASAGARGEVLVRFGSRRFSFPVPEGSSPEQAAREVEAARDTLGALVDDHERRKLDPLEPPAVEALFAPQVPRTRATPRWERRAPLFAAAIGVVVGVWIFYLRDVASDGRMFATAHGRDEVTSYKAYLSSGRRHQELVSRVLLPRAELRLAVAVGSVEAIDAFRVAYPETDIEPEIALARRAALVAEFEKAREPGTLSALLTFAERHPEHGLEPAFGRARHALYAKALARYRSAAPKTGGGDTAELVGRLLAYSERVGARTGAGAVRGPAVRIRFRRLPSQTMERADDIVRKSPMFTGATALPTRYLGPDLLEPHERAAAKSLSESLARGFDPEFIAFEPGPLFEGSDDDLLALDAPTLVVSYRVEPSGGAFAAKKPLCIFVGLVYFFRADFVLPADPKPLRVKHTITQRIPLEIVRAETGMPPPGTLEPRIYGTMNERSFSEMTKRYLAGWLEP